MRYVRLVLEWFGKLFSGGLCLAMIALGLVGKLTGAANFQLEMVPWWTGKELINALLIAGVAGMIITALAVRGKFKWLLAVWAGALLVGMIDAYFYGPLKYDGVDHFKSAAQLTSAQFTAFLGSLSQAFKKS